MKPSKPVHVRSHWRSATMVREHFRSLPHSSPERSSSGCVVGTLWFVVQVVVWFLMLSIILTGAMFYFFYELLAGLFNAVTSNNTTSSSSDPFDLESLTTETATVADLKTERVESSTISAPSDITQVMMNWCLVNSIAWVSIYLIMYLTIEKIINIESTMDLETFLLAVGGIGITTGICQSIVLSRRGINPHKVSLFMMRWIGRHPAV